VGHFGWPSGQIEIIRERGHIACHILCVFKAERKDSEKGATQVKYRSRGHLIRELLRLLRALDSMKAKTVKDISDESCMELRQAYRWLKALEKETMV